MIMLYIGSLLKGVDIMEKITAIYVRRSVSDKDKGNNSLSINAQKEECIKYVGNEVYQVYCDDGKSGKDIAHRPAFQQMMQDAREGNISHIVVKKYDRFSRNMREYLNITEELDKYGVSVYSLSEPFNTATKEGRMMRNNLLNFAEFERETIAARVADAYNTKARETGFYQGGKQYFGYKSSRQTVNGKTGSVLVPNAQAYAVKKAYEIYSNSCESLNSIVKYLRDNSVTVAYDNGQYDNISRSHLSRILASPLYVRADKEVYRYFASKGVEMIDDISAYDGVHGLYLHGRKGDKQFIKVGYHEGIVDADTWLAVQDRKTHTAKFHGKHSSKNTWLSGLVKCAHCGYAMLINHNATKDWRTYVDSGFDMTSSCVVRTPRIRPNEVEDIVYHALVDRLKSLEIAKREHSKPNPEIEDIKAKIINIENEINALMEKLAYANNTLVEYINQRIAKLDEEKMELEIRLHTLTRRIREVDTEPLKEPLKNWEKLSLKEKHDVAIKMIEVIKISDETGVDITFSI